MKKIIVTLVILTVISLSLFAQMNKKQKADNPCDDCNDHGTMMQPRNGMGNNPEMGKQKRMDILEELKLTKEQMKKIEALRQSNEKFMNTKRAELENLMIDKHNAMKNEEYAKAKTLNKSINDLQLSMENAMVDHHAAMLKELTPEQKEKFMEMMPMGRGNHPGPGMGKGMKGGMKHGRGGMCN